MTSPGFPSLQRPNLPRKHPVSPGQELAGKYRLERVVGTGAMGVVFEAWHLGLEQRVAVKFLYPEFARHADGAERFRREARAAVKIQSEHVARVLDVGTLADEDVPYIVMEYLEGSDLARLLADRGPLPMQEAVSYVLQACAAIAEAHEQGIVHRDLKPANLFVAERPNGQRLIKVLDFGISKINAPGTQHFSLTDTATLMGSPAYMSPEQLESSRNVDARADIWSLGVILHELIAGAMPFTGESVPQLVRAILAGQRQRLSELDPALEPLEGVVARCLRPNRDERYASVPEFCADLLPFAPSPAVSVPVFTLVTSGASPAPGAASHAREPRAGASGNPSPGSAAGGDDAWGHTQGGRRRTWLRRGVPALSLVSVAVGVGIGAWWVLSTRPERQPTAGQPLRPPERAAASAEPMAVEPMAADPVAATPAPAPAALPPPPDTDEAAPPTAPAPEVPAATPDDTPARPPSAPDLATATSPAREPRQPAPAPAAAPAERRAAVVPPAPPEAAPKSDKTENDSSHRSSSNHGTVLGIPDFGGRE